MMSDKQLMPKEDARLLLLYLLMQFEEICHQADIYYYASGGTGLGAIRHKGFIPWDDDIDIMMPRKFYERFVEFSEKVLKKPVIIRSRENDPYFCQEYIKLCFQDDILGWSDLSIDIFFLDETDPDKKVFRWIQNKILTDLYYIKLYKVSKDANGSKYTPNNKVKRFYLHVMSSLLSYRSIDRFHKKTMLAEKTKTDFVVNWGSCYSYKKATYRKSDLGAPRRVPFENTTIALAEHAEVILQQLYGADYMTPPLPEKRTDHGVRALQCAALDMNEVKREVELAR